MTSSDLLIYGGYLNVFLLFVKAMLFAVAALIIRPKGLEKLPYWTRLRVAFIPLENENEIFGGETKRVKLRRRLWISIFVIMGIRVLIGYYLAGLDFTKQWK